MKVKDCRSNGKPNGNIYFKCPATGKQIELATRTQWQAGQIVHQFNFDYNLPTISPAVLIVDGKDIGSNPDVDLTKATFINHFIIQNGNIRYLDDSTHTLKGRVVTLPDF